MEVISSVNDGEEKEYGLVINQEELEVLKFILGSFSDEKEIKIGLPKRITYDMYMKLAPLSDKYVSYKAFKLIMVEDLL